MARKIGSFVKFKVYGLAPANTWILVTPTPKIRAL